MRFVIVVGFLFLSNIGWGAEFTYSGYYTGKNVYIRNPFNAQQDKFCIQSVYVNDQLVVQSPEASAVLIALQDMQGMGLGDVVQIRVVHNEGCKPVIINPQALKRINKTFRFLTTTITNNSIEWSTEGEVTTGRYVIERMFTNNDKSTYWEDETSIPAKADPILNRYSVEPEHWLGLDNTYRIRYEPTEENPVYSQEIIYSSTMEPITFYPKSVTTSMQFSAYVAYEIYDMQGRMIKQGKSEEVYLEELKPGQYLLRIQNRFEKFVKK